MPDEVDSFVGRGDELARLRVVQAETRLLTLIGPGGVGKTRLALRLGAELIDAFPDGIRLVDLSPVADQALVPHEVGVVLGVQQPPGQSRLEELTRVLRAQRLLLVLDNCEHLVAAGADLVDGLLRASPRVKMLATSLQPLGATGETTWRVRPLSLPAAAGSEVQEIHA